MDMVKVILDNKLTIDGAEAIVLLLKNHDELIRHMAKYVLEGKVGKGDERKALLGKYFDEVQAKVNWTITTAENVWAGMYGNDEERRAKLGADYDLVMYRVNQTAVVTVPANLKYTTDKGGKRYVLKNVPTAKGRITWYGYDQHNQGSNPYVFDGSGCGFMSVYSVISTLKGYGSLPIEYANKCFKSVTGGSKCPISLMAGLRFLDKEKIQYEWVRSFGTASAYNDILLHLRKGQPVIVSLFKDSRAGKEDRRYTNYAHFAVLIGVTSNSKGYLLDSGGHKPRLVSLYDLCDHIPTAQSKPDYDPVWNGFSNCGGYVKIFM